MVTHNPVIRCDERSNVRNVGGSLTLLTNFRDLLEMTDSSKWN